MPSTGNQKILSGKQKLEESIYATKSINEYYKGKKSKDWIVNRQDEIPGEKWGNLEIDGAKIRVSDLGRIKQLINKKYKFLPLVECGGEDKKVDLPLDENVFQRMPESQVGWVFVKINGKSYLVYRLVTMAWLKKPADGYVVHHITNDGYDNSVYNLIYLSPSEHTSLHNKSKKITGQYTPLVEQYLGTGGERA